MHVKQIIVTNYTINAMTAALVQLGSTATKTTTANVKRVTIYIIVWWKFVVISFVPLTVFYFIFFFNINVTSSHLHGVVFFNQLASMPVCSCIASGN